MRNFWGDVDVTQPSRVHKIRGEIHQITRVRNCSRGKSTVWFVCGSPFFLWLDGVALQSGTTIFIPLFCCIWKLGILILDCFVYYWILRAFKDKSGGASISMPTVLCCDLWSLDSIKSCAFSPCPLSLLRKESSCRMLTKYNQAY